MESARKKRIIAVVAIVVAVALIVASIVALVVTNTSSEPTNSQTEQGSWESVGNSTSSHSEKDEQKGAEEGKEANNDGEGEKNNTSSETGESASRTVPPASGTVPSDATDTSRTVPSDQSQAESDINVYITIDGAGHGNASYAGNVTLDEGASVYDALMATGISVNARDSQYGTYVAAIGGLAEKSAGGESGWKYSVNGVEPQTSCSNYKLKSGDVVKWKFVTKASESVG